VGGLDCFCIEQLRRILALQGVTERVLHISKVEFIDHGVL
jgi:hypothetical protein